MKKSFGFILLIIILLIGFSVYIAFFRSRNAAQSIITPKEVSTVQKIRLVTTIHPANQLPVIVAEENRLFSKYNLEIEKQSVDNNPEKIVLAKQADMTMSPLSSSLAADLQGASLIWVGTFLDNNPMALISNQPLADIKTVGVVKSSFNTIVYSMLANKLSLDTDKINRLTMNSQPEALQALANSKVDAVIANQIYWEPFRRKNKLPSSFKVLIDNSALSELKQPGAIIVSKDFLQNNQTAVENFNKAIAESIEWISANPSDAAALMVKNLPGMSQEDAVYYVDTYIKINRNLDFAPSPEVAQNVFKLLTTNDMKVKEYEVEDFINLSVSAFWQNQNASPSAKSDGR